MPDLKTIQSRCLLSQYRPIQLNTQWERMAQTTNFNFPQEEKHKRPKEAQKRWAQPASTPTQTTWWISKLQISASLITILYQETRITPMTNSKSIVTALKSSESKNQTSTLKKRLLISQLLKAKLKLVWSSVTTRNKVSIQLHLRKW